MGTESSTYSTASEQMLVQTSITYDTYQAVEHLCIVNIP